MYLNTINRFLKFKFYTLQYTSRKNPMIQYQTQPIQHHQYNQKPVSNQPPKEKIINSKDDAIQQLIYQNTMLKKQLSQLMLKSTPNTSYQHMNALQSATTTVRPSVSHFNSSRNSLDNSMDFTNQIRGNRLVGNDNVCDSMGQNEEKIKVQKYKRSYRHSADNLGQNYQQNSLSTQQQNQYQNNQLFYQYPPQQNVHPVNFNLYPSVNQQTHHKLYQTSNTNQQQPSLTEQKLYREKMIKLKTRKNSHTKRLSEEKQSSNIVNANYAHTNQNFAKRQAPIQVRPVQQKLIQHSKLSKHQVQKRQQLIQAHQVLKSKLNSQIKKTQIYEQSPIFKIQNPTTQKVVPNQSSTNKIPINYDNKAQKQMKKFPKYTPKNFSRQKQNRTLPDQTRTNIPITNTSYSQKTVQRKATQQSGIESTNQSGKNDNKPQQKKICLRQLRGRVYLDDQGQGARTRRALSKNSASNINKTLNVQSNENQNTLRNNKKEEKSQLAKRINTVQSQVTYIDANSFKKLNPVNKHVILTEQPIVKKSSNQVYLDQDQPDKQILKNNLKQKDTKITPNQQKNTPKFIHQDTPDDLVSIEEIHMITMDRTDKNSNANKLQNQKTKKSAPPSANSKQSQPNQISRNKNLYNNVYCEQSKRDLHS